MNRRLQGWIVFAAAMTFAVCAVADDTAPVSAKKPAKPAQPARKLLDLRIPDITELYTPEQIQAMLATTRSDEDDLEVVEVKGARVPLTPDVWGGLAAPVWGLLHPLQSWRIIAPITEDRIHAADVTPEAQPMPRDPFRP